jgi:cell wall-associated NlpC family hydrolase
LSSRFLYLTFFLLALQNSKSQISADSLVAFCEKQVGTKYCYGSENPKGGFDCSGFVYYVFKHFKVEVPRTSKEFARIKKVIHPDSAKTGDVIIFTGTKAKNRTPGHVGIVLSGKGDAISFAHASSSKKHCGVTISTFNESPYYKKRFIKIVRVLHRTK